MTSFMMKPLTRLLGVSDAGCGRQDESVLRNVPEASRPPMIEQHLHQCTSLQQCYRGGPDRPPERHLTGLLVAPMLKQGHELWFDIGGQRVLVE
jgi:hypothetical protein